MKSIIKKYIIKLIEFLAYIISPYTIIKNFLISKFYSLLEKTGIFRFLCVLSEIRIFKIFILIYYFLKKWYGRYKLMLLTWRLMNLSISLLTESLYNWTPSVSMSATEHAEWMRVFKESEAAVNAFKAANPLFTSGDAQAIRHIVDDLIYLFLWVKL